MHRSWRWLALLAALTASGCWVTGDEVKRKVKQYETETPTATGDTAEPDQS